MDLSKYWLVRAIISGTGHDSDGFIADERAMGMYLFCLDRRLTAPDSEKTCILFLESTSGSPNQQKYVYHFCLD